MGVFTPETSLQETKDARSWLTNLMYVSSVDAGDHLKNSMPFLMDKILREIADQAYYASHLRRNGAQPTRDRVFAEVLAELEANGEAMRFVNAKGRIAWKATPRLRDRLMDLELEAEEDLEEL